MDCPSFRNSQEYCSQFKVQEKLSLCRFVRRMGVGNDISLLCQRNSLLVVHFSRKISKNYQSHASIHSLHDGRSRYSFSIFVFSANVSFKSFWNLFLHSLAFLQEILEDYGKRFVDLVERIFLCCKNHFVAKIFESFPFS